jgi:hypothetical protein
VGLKLRTNTNTNTKPYAMTKPSLNYYIEGSDPDNRRSSTKSLDFDGSGDTFYSAKES